MSRRNHSWIEIHKTPTVWHCFCERCGLQKESMSGNGVRWIEYRTPHGPWMMLAKTPDCERP